jgi:peroxiredoxin
MRTLLTVSLALALALVAGSVRADDKDKPKESPKIVLQSPDGKTTYDLDKLTANGPVLVRLTCACSGCDQELAFFQKLQEAYNGKGLQTIAVFREKPEAVESYAVKKDIKFMWLSDPKGDLWKTFDSKAMPTNILIDKGGKVVKIVPGCTKDGKNAQILSAEIAKLLKTDEAVIVEKK